jgi:hypothetical protein
VTSSAPTTPRKSAVSIHGYLVIRTFASGRYVTHYEIHVATSAIPYDPSDDPCQKRKCGCRVLLTQDAALYQRALAAEGTEKRVSVSYHPGRRHGKQVLVLDAIKVGA